MTSLSLPDDSLSLTFLPDGSPSLRFWLTNCAVFVPLTRPFGSKTLMSYSRRHGGRSRVPWAPARPCATVAPISSPKRTLCAAATLLRTPTPPTRPPVRPPARPPGDGSGKGASKLPRCARNPRRTALLPGAPPPPPVPPSPPDAPATLVPRRAAALSSHKRARCRVRVGAPSVPQGAGHPRRAA